MNHPIHPLLNTSCVLCFLCNGICRHVGVATGYVKHESALSDTLTQFLTMMIFLWFALLSIPVGIFQDKKGKKVTVNLGIILTGIGMLIPLICLVFVLFR